MLGFPLSLPVEYNIIYSIWAWVMFSAYQIVWVEKILLLKEYGVCFFAELYFPRWMQLHSPMGSNIENLEIKPHQSGDVAWPFMWEDMSHICSYVLLTLILLWAFTRCELSHAPDTLLPVQSHPYSHRRSQCTHARDDKERGGGHPHQLADPTWQIPAIKAHRKRQPNSLQHPS